LVPIEKIRRRAKELGLPDYENMEKGELIKVIQALQCLTHSRSHLSWLALDLAVMSASK